MDTVPRGDRPTRTVRYPELNDPAVMQPHPEIPGATTIVPLEPGVYLGHDRFGAPYVVSDVRHIDGVTEITLVPVVAR